MAEIIKIYKESLPSLKLIGKKYSNEDRDQYGSFGSKWGDEWFANGLFEKIENLKNIDVEPGSYLGVMRSNQGKFEYWIGMFFEEDVVTPAGFEEVKIPAGDIATCWVKGKEETGELYNCHDACVDLVKKSGYEIANTWFFERYACPRFTEKDKDGNVVLDYCMYIK